MTPTARVRVVGPEEDAASILQTMEAEDLSGLPVVEEGRLLGLVSRESLARSAGRAPRTNRLGPSRGRASSGQRASGFPATVRGRPALTLATLGGPAGWPGRRLRQPRSATGWRHALPGLVAEALAPGLAAELASQLGSGSLIVTGTNGKTTTARMIAGIASTAGLQPLPNRSGSNLMRGIATALMDEADARGRLRDGPRRLGVFEVDEATLPQAVEALRPRVLLFTNLFRDQLDRYGEVDSVAACWRRTLESG